MSERIAVIGVDPGLVHTGLVAATFDPTDRVIHVDHQAMAGEIAETVKSAQDFRTWVRNEYDPGPTFTFVESYRPRGNTFSTDTKMRQLLDALRQGLRDAKVLDNTGVRKVVRTPLQRVLGLDKFPTTHHQDLEAAARILTYGMLKDHDLNLLVTNVVLGHIEADPWQVRR